MHLERGRIMETRRPGFSWSAFAGRIDREKSNRAEAGRFFVLRLLLTRTRKFIPHENEQGQPAGGLEGLAAACGGTQRRDWTGLGPAQATAHGPRLIVSSIYFSCPTFLNPTTTTYLHSLPSRYRPTQVLLPSNASTNVLLLENLYKFFTQHP